MDRSASLKNMFLALDPRLMQIKAAVDQTEALLKGAQEYCEQVQRRYWATGQVDESLKHAARVYSALLENHVEAMLRYKQFIVECNPSDKEC